MQQVLLYIPSFYGISIEVYFIVLLLATSLFFAWRWLFKKLIKSKWKLAATSMVVAIMSTPIVYVLVASIFFLLLLHYPHDEFDKERWLINKKERYELSGDIIESKMLLGKSKTEVKQLLGDDYEGTGDYWEYYLGLVPSIGGVDPDVLDIYFENDKVVRVGQHET